MNLKYRRLSAAALTLVFCLTVAPITEAKPVQNRDRFEPRERIVKIVKRIKDLVWRISSFDDGPQPPNPNPKP